MSRIRWRTDDGQLTLLVIGFAVVGMLMVAVVLDTSAVFLARRDVVSAADSAALAAAQQVDLDRYYTGGEDRDLPLDASLGDRVVAELAGRFVGVRFTRVELTDGGRGVRVRASRIVQLPFGGFFGIGAVTVTADATARTPGRG